MSLPETPSVLGRPEGNFSCTSNVVCWKSRVGIAVVFLWSGTVLRRDIDVFSSLRWNVVTSDSVEDGFKGALVDVFRDVTQSAGRRSLHLWILLSTSPFFCILAATQNSGYPAPSKKYIQIYLWNKYMLNGIVSCVIINNTIEGVKENRHCINQNIVF